MLIPDKERAIQEISQIGYYRLSGYWHPCRQQDEQQVGQKLESFIDGTRFNDVLSLYLFDKKLRFFLLDAIERIEIILRTTLAHELGQFDPIAYNNADFIAPQFLTFRSKYPNKKVPEWQTWCERQQSEIKRSKEAFVAWHTQLDQSIPIWAAVETWSFGTLSMFYKLLKRQHQQNIADKIGVSHSKTLASWLMEINTLRNRCAHHSRIWNQLTQNPIKFLADAPNVDFFQPFMKSSNTPKKMFNLIVILWFLIQKAEPRSEWMFRFYDHLQSFPPLPLSCQTSMGIPQDIYQRYVTNSQRT